LHWLITFSVHLGHVLARYGGFFSEPFPVERFVLFSSRPNQGGGPYLVEEGYPARDTAFYEDEEAAA